MKKNSRIIRNYARVLFNSAFELKDVQGVKHRFGEIASLLKSVPEFRLLLVTRRIDQAGKMKILSNALHGMASDFEMEFLKILLENGEINHLAEILNLFFIIASRESDTVDVTISSAMELDEELYQKIIENIRKSMKKKVVATTAVEPALLGGISLRIGNSVIDGSVAKRLEKLKTALTGA